MSNKKKKKSWFHTFFKLHYANRKYKDRLFQRVFEDKKDLLDLYNAINDTDYSNPEDLEITTLEDVIFMSMKNDKSFIISSTMNLYEHQSSINPNMPIRGLLYFAQLYDEYIKLHNLNVYSKSLVKLPLPQYIVFYNGQDNYPDDITLLLSDAFECDPNTPAMEPALECKARVLNVNFGHNAKLMKKCIRLMHYSQFIAKINQNIKGGMPVTVAIDTAINYCIQNGILEDILIKNRSEVRHMLLTEFDQKKFAKSMWNEGHEVGFSEGHQSGFSEGHQSGFSEGHQSGFSEGHQSGFSEGHQSGFSEGHQQGSKKGHDDIFTIMDEINNGNNTYEKLIALGYSPELVKKVLEKMK